MHYNSIQFEIDQLRKERMVSSIESILMFVFALFTLSLLPDLLFLYFFAEASIILRQQIMIYFQLAVVTLGVANFLIVAFNNVIRSKKIKDLEEEMAYVGDCECGGDCGCGHDGWDDLEDLDALVEEALKEAEKSNKKAASKSTKSSSKAKKSTRKKSTKK